MPPIKKVNAPWSRLLGDPLGLSNNLAATTEIPNDLRRLVGSAPFAAFGCATKVQDQPVQDLGLSLDGVEPLAQL